MKPVKNYFIPYFLLVICFMNFNLSAEEVVLPLGGSKLFKIKNHNIWIEKKSIILGQVVAGQLKISAKGIGKSYLKLNGNLHSIQVVSPQNLDLFQKINQLIATKIGLKAETKNSEIIISGRLYKMMDWIQLSKLISESEDYSFKASLSESLQEEANAYFNKIFVQNGLPEQKIQTLSHPVIRLHPSDPHFKEYETLLHPFGIKIIKDKTSLALAPVIKVQITVAEVNRSFSQNFGVEFSDSYQAEILPVTKIKDFEAKLHFLEDSGNGRLLASPNIICRSGKEAEFLAGGEFPIRIRNKFSSDITWKKYGVLLKVQPKADSLGRMSIGIQSEISSLDKANSVDDIPAITTNKVSSYFDLTDSKIIALSGLLTDVQGNNSKGFPFLARLPILGGLFSSQSFLKKRSELIIFVKPTIMKMSEDFNKAKDKAQHLGEL